MNIELKFTDLTLEEVQHIANSVLGLTLVGETTALKPQRKRRTKAEIAKDRDTQAKAAVENNLDAHLAEAEEQEIAAEQQEGPDDPPEPRRRKRGDDVPAGRQRQRAEATPEEKPKRGKRRKKADDDEISDADVAKAASEGAQRLTPKVVTGILEEFGVSNVAELSQEQRREFMKALDDYVAY